MFRIIIALSVVFVIGSVSNAQSGEKSIRWYTFEEAVKLSKEQPRKIFIDVYTGWCGWCKKMDATTFKDPAVIELANKYFYSVKFDAETRDSIYFDNRYFIYSPEKRSNELASALLNGKMSYPTTVYLNEDFSMLSPVPGYLTSDVLSKILKYYGENFHKQISWEEFSKVN